MWRLPSGGNTELLDDESWVPDAGSWPPGGPRSENDRMAEQVRSPAEVYESQFVPALFGQWGAVMVERAGIARGHRVLDVGCGTGALTCAAAERTAAVVGIDPNEEMLAVARRKSATIEWKHGRAEDIPFSAGTFDVVASQFAMMFFEERVKALREMWRVLRPGGRLAVAVCGALDFSPGYAVLAELLHRLFGPEVAEAFRAPFVLGDPADLRALAEEAQLPGAEITRQDGTVRFGSIASLVSTERACVWTLGGLLDEAQFDRLRQEAETSLKPFRTEDSVEFSMPALILTASKR